MALPLWHLEHTQRVKHGGRRRHEVMPVQTNHLRARVGCQLSTDVQQAGLANAWWTVDVEYQERRFGRLQSGLKQLDFGCAANKAVPPARRQEVADSVDRPCLGHSGSIGLNR